MTKVYLCGPINGCTDAECNDWRELVKMMLTGETINPMRRDYRGRELEDGIDREIVRGDMEDCLDADVLLAFHPKPSSGTDMEIFYVSFVLKKPVVTIIPEGAPLSPWVKRFSTIIFKTEREACDWINGCAA